MKQQPHLLIDSDILVYQIAFGCKGYDLAEVCRVMDQTVYKIIERFSIPHTLVLSNTDKTFRHEIAITAPYKGNRKAEKPEYYHELREYLLTRWDAELSPSGLEADDLIGIRSNRKAIIATIDKDLKMIPAAWHYNFTKDTLVKVKRNLYYFWHQMLTGDRADNIIGLTGIGEAKATKLLKGVKLKDMKSVIMKEYVREFGEKAQDRFHENAQLLWILREPNKFYFHYI